MSNIGRYRDILERLRPLLPDYLASHGVEIGAGDKFRCFSPDHADTHPSANLIPNTGREKYYCHSCGISGDVFSAAHILEGRPLFGKAFLDENVFSLARQFSIAFEPFVLEEENLRNSELMRAYETAGSLLSFSTDSGPAEQTYGWTLEQIQSVEPHVGTVDWAVFTKRMRDLGDYSSTYLDSIGLNGKLFGSHLLTFALKDHAGKIRGFASRDSREKKIGGSVWYNTAGNIPIFVKSQILYGLNVARMEKGPIYLVEGYSDVIALRLRGLKKVVAYMTSHISAGQVDQLRKSQCTEVVLVPDWDANNAGELATEKALEQVFGGREDFTVRIKPLPASEEETTIDPRAYLNPDKGNSVEDFLRLPEYDAFDWRLSRLEPDLSPEEQADKVFGMIVAEHRAIRQEAMLSKLSEKTGVRLTALRRDLDRLLEENRREVRKKLQRKVDQVRSAMDTTDPKQLPEVFRASAIEMERVQNLDLTSDAHGPEETESFIRLLEREFWDRGKDLPGWSTGLTSLDDRFGGIPRKEAWIMIAGDGSAGKTALAQNLGLQVALRNEDVAVLLFTIDDTRSQAVPRLIAQICELQIKWVTQPQRYAEVTPKRNEAMRKAFDTLREMARTGRFDIKDASQGSSITFAERWIEAVRETYPGRPILFILDSFHRLREDGPSKQAERERLEHYSSRVAGLAKQRGVTVISTMELRKREYPTTRPRIEDLKGTKQLEYDANVVILVHNEMHAKPDDPNAQHWIDEDDRQKPILQCWIHKNKLTGWEGCVELRLRPETSQVLDQAQKPPPSDPASVPNPSSPNPGFR